MATVLRRVSKSFTTLINTSYSMKITGQTSEDNIDSGLLSNPLSFLHSANFNWDGASLGWLGGAGYYWSLRSTDATFSNDLLHNNTYLVPLDYSQHGFGFAVPPYAFSKLIVPCSPSTFTTSSYSKFPSFATSTASTSALNISRYSFGISNEV